MKKLPIAALFASTALIPAAFAQTNSIDIKSIDDAQICRELVSYVEANDTDATGMTGDRAETIAAGEDVGMCRDAMRLAIGETLDDETMATLNVEATADIQVAVPEPQVRVQQAAPQVSVQQPQPDVNVTPGRPIVTVNQAEPVVHVTTTPPKVTIDMPKPEILVEIPDPTVDVAMARPRVSVTQPEPTVSVEQGQVQLAIGDKQIDKSQTKAKVDVEQANATVRVDEAEASNVNVAEVQPEIRYNAAKPRVEMSETGKPDIEFNQSGEANVRFKRMSAEETRAAAAGQSEPNRETARAAAEAKNAEATAARATDGATDRTAAATNADASAESTGPMTVSDLMDRKLIGNNGKTIGDVENVVTRDGETYLVVGSGGLLGLGEKQIAIPINEVVFRDDQLFTPSTTEEAVDRMAEYDANTFKALGTDQDVEIVLQ